MRPFPAHYIVAMGVRGELNTVTHLSVRDQPFLEHGNTEAEVNVHIIVDPNIALAGSFSVETSGILRFAMAAQAITVFPEPGGATSTPDSRVITWSNAVFWGGRRVSGELNRSALEAWTEIDKFYRRSSHLDKLHTSREQAPRQNHPVSVVRKLRRTYVAGRVPSREAHAL